MQPLTIDLPHFGKRGAGLATTVLGSVASRLARDAPSPVLVLGD